MGQEQAPKPEETSRPARLLERANAEDEHYHDLLAHFPKEVDIGEQINGSNHTYEVVSPLGFPHPRPVTAATRFLRPHEWFTTEEPHTFVHGPKTQPIRVGFKPTFDGAYESDLQVDLAWGTHAVSKLVRVLARSRDLEDVPWREAPAKPAAARPKGKVPEENDESATSAAFENAVERAQDSAGELGQAMQDGLQLAEDEIKAYEKTLPEMPNALRLALAALEIAVTAVAGGAATALMPAVYKALAKKIVQEETRRFVEGAITEGLQEFFSQLLTSAVEKATASASSPNSDAPDSNGSSTNASIAFFNAQRQAVRKMNSEIKTRIREQVKRVRGHADMLPAGAKAVEALAGVLRRQAAIADHTYRFAVEQMWISGLARASQSGEVVEDRQTGTRFEVTEMKGSVSAAVLGKARGVVEISADVKTDASGDSVLVPRTLRLLGVSQEVVDVLHTNPLIDAKVPVVVLLTSGANGITAISRDEAGRVRATVHDPVVDEANAHLKAASMLDRLLGTSLKAQGASTEHDDATGRGGAK